MNKFKQLLFLSALILLVGCAVKDENPHWVINEVMVDNQTGYMDDFGQRNGWIEIFNNTYKTQDLGGRFLTDDPNNPKKYPIPRGDVLTKIPPRQHVLFWADNEPFNGTFHVNFKLDPTKDNYIALYENDGKTLLDEIVIPAGLPTDKTYGYPTDGVKYDKDGNYLAAQLERVTPSSNNAVLEENPKVTLLSESDPWGVMMTMTSMLVVFVGLLLLYLIFRAIGNTAKRISHKRVASTGTLSAVRSESLLTGEVLAAISAAIYELNQDVHDVESTILTISEVKRKYSPWSSKLYTLRQDPRR
ncbi:Na+-transporting methylmalonyl-CoA/oxaloacetate decarboxylase, gamma subunit [Porphyromonadaceae bacterium KHP3R9]|jgi:Na+-transporting methylmalonyl-CoA/oxaloacetate decarboxylase gamma subunit|uniref:lamin tail domain-containing protein n=1 Tax=Petrimonas mucosa TaxID=1642646 RepID=UPI0008E0CEE8|nr:Na+-transporting methylmalonyl-CoA/oxaloacetate decarboxylase, gamma subunit [Porphyromonadaceae bacterium KHP3R9]